MSTLPSRHDLEADLLRHQAAGDFAAQAETLMQLAQIAAIEEEFSIAQGLYGQAWAAYEQVGDTANMALILYRLSNNLSKALFEAGRWPMLDFDRDAVNAFYLMAADYYAELGYVEQQAMVYSTMGVEADDESSDIDAARYAYEKALPLYEMTNNSLAQANILLRLGETYIVGDPEHIYFVTRALKLYQQIEHKEGEERALWSLGSQPPKTTPPHTVT